MKRNRMCYDMPSAMSLDRLLFQKYSLCLLKLIIFIVGLREGKKKPTEVMCLPNILFACRRLYGAYWTNSVLNVLIAAA